MHQTVFVIDDDEAARDSLTFLLRTEGMTSRAFSSGRSFLDQLHKDQRGCIITDVRMPEMDGISMVNTLAEMGCTMPIIVITGHADVPLAVEAMKAGVADFIEKPFESEAMVGAVRQCLETAHVRSTDEDRRATIIRRRDMLTDREAQVLALVVDGMSNKEIANQLGISFRTVEIYRAHVMSKMQAESLSALVRMTMSIAA
jgi:two-component system response regulator FixJ